MSVTILNSDNIAEAISSSDITIVDFWAEWCGPCKALSPLLDDLSSKYEGTIKVAKINVSDSPEVAKANNVSSIPCLIVFRGGKEIDRVIGFGGKESLEDVFIKHS